MDECEVRVTGAWSRLDECVRAWRVEVARVTETGTSVLAFGHRDGTPVVLKVVRRPGDEWPSGEVLDAFGGRGVVRVHEHVPGALLLERLDPGRSLASLVLSGADDQATAILARVIGRMSPVSTAGAPTAEDWGQSFDRYAASGDGQVPRQLVSSAHRMYSDLCRSQRRVRLLHGDLHHGNVLFDTKRGWIGVDPKGVVAEVEYELGAALRNPYESPTHFASPSVVRRRVGCFASELGVDSTRVMSWAFAQAVLATIWLVEDGHRVQPGHVWIRLAEELREMLAGSV